MVSNTAEIFQGLFSLFTWLGILVGVVVITLFLVLILKYRDRGSQTPEPQDAPMLGKVPAERGHLKTVLISLTMSIIILTFLLNGTFGAIDTLNTPPAGTLNVQVDSFQWGWKFIYPNNYEDTILRVPKDEPVILKIVSPDVAHSFGILEFNIKMDAIPGRTNIIWFVAKETGEFNIACFEFCGVGHAYMKTKLIVMDPTEFQDWYSKAKPAEAEHQVREASRP
ncbi:MAG: cytochrome c oxidase subunit II [Thaumarchaeota archaeon]|nr:cytochrome c oxidase subunit II [Nitrososphaerota archaeon]